MRKKTQSFKLQRKFFDSLTTNICTYALSWSNTLFILFYFILFYVHVGVKQKYKHNQFLRIRSAQLEILGFPIGDAH